MWGDFSVERERKRKQLCHSVLFLFQLERAKDRQRHNEATQRRCADRSGQFLRPACPFLPGFAWGFVLCRADLASCSWLCLRAPLWPKFWSLHAVACVRWFWLSGCLDLHFRQPHVSKC